MPKTMSKRFLPALLILVLLGAAPGAAQLKKIKEALGGKPDAEKTERQRAKIEALAQELYEIDSDFKDAVDNHYRETLRQHSERAYRINTSSPSNVVVIREDRFRRHSDSELTLYDNLAIQSYVNRLGQRFAPADSNTLYAFRLVATPIPYAEALSTGTVYLSTGLIALLDNEAQLAYVLAHEMAHVYKEHWKWKSKLHFAATEFAERREKKRAVLGAVVGGLVGAKLGGFEGAVVGAGATGFLIAAGQPKLDLEWDTVQEDEADEIAFQVIQTLNYDVREVGNLYATLRETALHDTRVTVGFIGRTDRLKERHAHTARLIQKALEASSSDPTDLGPLIDSRRYKELMAELRRDNGIQALYHDMFHIARINLRQAVDIRSNDPTALYYYGKVLELVGQTEEDVDQAKELFRRAAEHDFRNWNFGAHLHYALMLMDEGNPEMAETELQEYINSYSNYRLREFAIRQLPSHLDTLVDYMMLNGRADWVPTLPEAPQGFVFTNGALPSQPGN